MGGTTYHVLHTCNTSLCICVYIYIYIACRLSLPLFYVYIYILCTYIYIGYTHTYTYLHICIGCVYYVLMIDRLEAILSQPASLVENLGLAPSTWVSRVPQLQAFACFRRLRFIFSPKHGPSITYTFDLLASSPQVKGSHFELWM